MFVSPQHDAQCSIKRFGEISARNELYRGEFMPVALPIKALPAGSHDSRSLAAVVALSRSLSRASHSRVDPRASCADGGEEKVFTLFVLFSVCA